METQTKTSGNAKDFFINLGAIVSLYVLVGALIDLFFTVINNVYPQINSGYNYMISGQSISWQVATLIIFSPIFILLMYLLEKEYTVDPDKKNLGIHKWLTYITLFFSGLAVAIDLTMVLYYFIDGEELTAGFLLKILAVFVVAGCVFTYYISDITNKLTSKSRVIWRVVAGVLVLGAIISGFAILGSPRTQKLYRYDERKVNDLTDIKFSIENYYSQKGVLPVTITEAAAEGYGIVLSDPQSNLPYEYEKIDERNYNLCAEFNKELPVANPETYTIPYPGYQTWTHPAGHYCFKNVINPDLYSKPVPIR